MFNQLLCCLTLFVFTFCLPLIVSTNVWQIVCDYHKYGPIGCPQDTHLVCNNGTNYCQCIDGGEYGISFGGRQCLPVRLMDQKCLISDQCLKSAKNQLFCYYLDPKQQKLIKLNATVAMDLSQRYNHTVEGFCRCDDHHYYDYEENQCIHRNTSRDFDLNLSPIFDEYFCSQCPTIDENSFCDRKTRNCLCNEGFAKNSYGKCVRMRQLYQKCDQTDECVVDNSYCEPIVEECICGSGYVADAHKQRCLKGRAVFEKCYNQKECNYAYSYCDPIRAQCLCDNSSVLLNTYSPVCVKRTNYGQSCHNRLPDVVCQLSVGHSVCNKYTNRCICQNGYLFVANECQKLNGFGDEFHDFDTNKNPMTYIVIVFCTVFGFTVLASILIKIFRKPFTRTQLTALYDINNTLNQIQATSDSTPSGRLPGLPTAPPVYTESALRGSPQTLGSRHTADNEDKPPSYEEAISEQFTVTTR